MAGCWDLGDLTNFGETWAGFWLSFELDSSFQNHSILITFLIVFLFVFAYSSDANVDQ